MPQTETLEDILKILDAQRPTEAPPASTRVDQPEGYLENGEWVQPNQGPDSTWLGEMVSESKYLPVPAHGDEERYRKVVKDQLDFWVPQTAPMVGLTAAGGPLIKGAAKLGAPLVKPIKSVVNKVKDLYYKSRGMMAEKEVVNLTRTLQEISERASIQRPLDTPVVDFLQSRPHSQTTTIPSMTVQPGRTLVERVHGGPSGTSSFTDEVAARQNRSYRELASEHQENFNQQRAIQLEDDIAQGRIGGQQTDDIARMTNDEFIDEFAAIADDVDDIQPSAADLGQDVSIEGMEEIVEGLHVVDNVGPLPSGKPIVHKVSGPRRTQMESVPKIKVGDEVVTHRRIEYPKTPGQPGQVLIEHSKPLGPGRMQHTYRLQHGDAFKQVMKENPSLRWATDKKEIRRLIADKDLSRMIFTTTVVPPNPQIIGAKEAIQIKGLNFYTGTKRVKNAEGQWVKELIGTNYDSGRIMLSVFDRFPDNWIISSADNSFTMDSFTNLIRGVLKRADEIRFHPELNPSTSIATSSQSRYSKEILKATGPEGRALATQKNMDDIMKQLKRAGKTSEVIGDPRLRAGPGEIQMSHFTIRHMKEALAMVFGISVSQMKGLLSDMSEITPDQPWEDKVMSGEEYF